MVLMEEKKKTHTHTELPNRSPELAVTKTQLSLGRKRRRRIWRFKTVFTQNELSSLYVSLSWTDQQRQLECQIITSHTFFQGAHRFSPSLTPIHRETLAILSLLTHTSYLFSSLSKPPLPINLLIRNYANDPKTERKSVRQVWVLLYVYVFCAELVLKKKKKIQPAEKISSKAVNPAPLLSSSSIPS